MAQFGKRFVSGHRFSDATEPFSAERLLAAWAFQPQGVKPAYVKAVGGTPEGMP